MQPYDILMLVVLVGSTLFGFWKGMAWQIASLASVVVSALVASQFGEQLAPLFGEQAPWNCYIAMLVLYLVTALAIWLVFRLVAGVGNREEDAEAKKDQKKSRVRGMANVSVGPILDQGMVTLNRHVDCEEPPERENRQPPNSQADSEQAQGNRLQNDSGSVNGSGGYPLEADRGADACADHYPEEPYRSAVIHGRSARVGAPQRGEDQSTSLDQQEQKSNCSS